MGIFAFVILDFWILRLFFDRMNTRDTEDKLSFFEGDLPTFWKSIDGYHQKIWYAQEIYNKR